jgi:5-deoxy-glucuronate isomerase
VVATLAARGRETNLIDLRLVRIAEGASETVGDDGEMCAVVLDGAVDVRVGTAGLGIAVRDGDVFDSSADAVYVPPGEMLELRAVSDAVVAVAAAPVADREARRAARLIRPGDQHVRSAGTGNWSRTIRTLLGPDDDAGRLVVGETVNPPGNWSSYPPHKHDRDAPPEEVALEEVYLYRFKPEGGFGVQLLYDDVDERAHIVRHGDVIVIPSGYHPVVAAPGYALYYLWVMAGAGRALAPYLDPRHAWIQTASQ